VNPRWEPWIPLNDPSIPGLVLNELNFSAPVPTYQPNELAERLLGFLCGRRNESGPGLAFRRDLPLHHLGYGYERSINCTQRKGSLATGYVLLDEQPRN
jgi:hypothetical protein